jgi:hypothetical protein
MLKRVGLALGLLSACTSTTPPREDAATAQPEAPAIERRPQARRASNPSSCCST